MVILLYIIIYLFALFVISLYVNIVQNHHISYTGIQAITCKGTILNNSLLYKKKMTTTADFRLCDVTMRCGSFKRRCHIIGIFFSITFCFFVVVLFRLLFPSESVLYRRSVISETTPKALHCLSNVYRHRAGIRSCVAHVTDIKSSPPCAQDCNRFLGTIFCLFSLLTLPSIRWYESRRKTKTAEAFLSWRYSTVHRIYIAGPTLAIFCLSAVEARDRSVFPPSQRPHVLAYTLQDTAADHTHTHARTEFSRFSTVTDFYSASIVPPPVEWSSSSSVALWLPSAAVVIETLLWFNVCLFCLLALLIYKLQTLF